MNGLRTHTGEQVTGERYTAARDKVADWYADNARAIRSSDCYAAHVTTEQKDSALAKGLAFAAGLKAGERYGFSVWQRINEELTGECVALLPKK